jgi:putative SOS response-associated peptidase YedK
MCTRFVLEQTRIRALLAALGFDADGTETTGPVDRHNIAPGTPIAALRATPAGLAAFRPRWGFSASDSDLSSPLSAPRSPLTNARAETLAQKPTFRDAFRRRRCLVPATGFYEWEKRGRARLPWLFRLRDGAPFAFAALWENTPDDEARAVIVTTAPNALMAPIHHRMPALLVTPEACRAWLDPRADEIALTTLLAPADATAMTATPVSPRMNRADFDSPECVAPAIHGLATRDISDDATGEFAF